MLAFQRLLLHSVLWLVMILIKDEMATSYNIVPNQRCMLRHIGMVNNVPHPSCPDSFALGGKLDLQLWNQSSLLITWAIWLLSRLWWGHNQVSLWVRLAKEVWFLTRSQSNEWPQHLCLIITLLSSDLLFYHDEGTGNLTVLCMINIGFGRVHHLLLVFTH